MEVNYEIKPSTLGKDKRMASGQGEMNARSDEVEGSPSHRWS
jgi:hypothetical protein